MQIDISLGPKLEKIENMTEELSQEFIESLQISPKTDAEIKRFLVHQLDGDPAEIVRTQASQGKSGLEQYRCLAQLCDPQQVGATGRTRNTCIRPSRPALYRHCPPALPSGKIWNFAVMLEAAKRYLPLSESWPFSRCVRTTCMRSLWNSRLWQPEL